MKYLFGTLVALLAPLTAAAADGSPLPREVMINGVEFVQIPEGDVWIPIPHIDPKSGESIDAGTREPLLHTRTYYLAKYEARARDFLRFIAQAEPAIQQMYDAPGKHIAGNGAEDGCGVRKAEGRYYLVSEQQDLPVTHLSWDVANAFAGWMGFRLPTEVEWVRAFRGNDKRIFPWGNEYPDDTYAAFQEGATECNVQTVTAYPKGQSPFGVYNMAGNVFEYVADWYNMSHYNALRDGDVNPVATTPETNNLYPVKSRVLRGGRWASSVSELSIYGNRDLRATGSPFICFGVRFALDASAVQRHLAAGTAKPL